MSKVVETDEDGDPDVVCISIDDAIERLGFGWFQIRILVAAGLCFMADAMEVLLLSFLSVVLEVQWGLDGTQVASLTSSVFAGAMLGTLILGPLGDVFGRKPLFTATAALIAVFGIATAWVTHFGWFIAIRFMVGFGVGGLTVPFDTLSEFLPTSHRGTQLLYIDYFWGFGGIMVAFVAIWTLDTSWQLFVLLCAIPCVLSTVIGIIVVPESPRWLLAQGRAQEAMETLRSAAQINGKDPQQVFPFHMTLEEEKEEEIHDFRALFSKEWRRTSTFLWITWCGFAFLYYGTIMVTTRVFSTIEDQDNDNQNDTYDFDYQAIFWASSSELLGVFLVSFTVDRYGRIASQAVCYILGGLSVLILCLLATNPDRHSRMLQITLAVFGRLFMMAASCLTWVSTAEMLDTSIRTTGHAAANAMGRIGGFVAPFVINNVSSIDTTGSCMMAVSFIVAFACSQLPETSGVAMGKAQNTRKALSQKEEDVIETSGEYEIPAIS